MQEGRGDTFLSAVSSGLACALLCVWLGFFSVPSFFMFLCFVYFISKLGSSPKLDVPSDFHVIIIGSGVSGICMGKKLNDIGVKYTILEKSADIGGTWYDNKYPGVACDVPSHLYSFSFYLNPNWSRLYSPGREIHAYLQKAASRFNVYPHIQLNKKVINSSWDSKACLWTVNCQDGSTYTANILITGSGALHKPRLPDFKGMNVFKGESFHTANWDTNFDPTNKKIAVVGTGASAVQAVPNLSTMGVSSLKVFQRTPCWSPPRFDYQYPEYVKRIFEVAPFFNVVYRYFFFLRNELRFRAMFIKNSNWIANKLSETVHNTVRNHYMAVIKDKELAKKLIPNFEMGCKRITPSDSYIQAYNKEFVSLITDKIEEITETGIKTADGTVHEVDAIVYATGFDLLKSFHAFKYDGVDGKMVSESDAPSGYYGITNSDLPNTFWLLGPGTGLGHNSIIYMIECQADYVIDGISKMIKNGARSMMLKKEVQRNYWDYVQENMKGKVFADNSACTGWYRNSRGVNWTLWPKDLISYWWETKTCDMNNYIITY